MKRLLCQPLGWRSKPDALASWLSYTTRGSPARLVATSCESILTSCITHTVPQLWMIIKF
ncbi:hypothetical protein OIDMADRAFT_18864 [Oidiodendron maius Zn]|uniref:Uncharacterized protein n=1 Tax=Oidiodendron maius (strain Zn) TaxID=913774 RepID=A0A0C3CT57_OIDMZ|nr:hypothetical protein OIDMADRAFT_18864 [Oidiodendron maius Zn]